MPQTPTTLAENRARELARLGNFLDSFEAGVLSVSPKQYQTAARNAMRLIEENKDCEFVLEVTALSPALQELRSNLGLVKAINIGLLELPNEVLRALSA